MSRTYSPEFHISGGFLLLTAWFTLANGWKLLWIILSAAAFILLIFLLCLPIYKSFKEKI